MAEIIYLTQEGYQEKKDELDYLLHVKRPQIELAISKAREFGDLSENAEYTSAKEEQGHIEDRIRELNALLENVQILERDASMSSSVQVGSSLILYDEDMDEEMRISIVSTVEADIATNKISNQSPLGQGLIGKKVGDEVEIKAPAGILKFRIVRIF